MGTFTEMCTKSTPNGVLPVTPREEKTLICFYQKSVEHLMPTKQEDFPKKKSENFVKHPSFLGPFSVNSERLLPETAQHLENRIAQPPGTSRQ